MISGQINVFIVLHKYTPQVIKEQLPLQVTQYNWLKLKWEMCRGQCGQQDNLSGTRDIVFICCSIPIFHVDVIFVTLNMIYTRQN